MKAEFNPYSGIDWSSVRRVNAISHEHIFRQDQLQNAYDRGIRFFACVNYRPSMPSYPLADWDLLYRDYTSLEDLTIEEKEYSGAIPTISDGAVNTDDLPQVPNAEHPQFTDWRGQHFNMLGSLFPDPGNGTFGTPSWRAEHPFFSMMDVYSLFTASGIVPFGKLFGTINHCRTIQAAETAIHYGNGLFYGFEVFNQGYTREVRAEFVKTYDALLKKGYRLFPLAVVDWQGDVESYGLPGQDMDSYVKTVDFDRGCNVLLVPSSYDGLPSNGTENTKASVGLDAYIAGRFYASGLGTHYISDMSEKDGNITISLDTTPSRTSVVVDGVRQNLANRAEMAFVVPEGARYVRFEFEWADHDFIYTCPIWYEPSNSSARKYLVLHGKKVYE